MLTIALIILSAGIACSTADQAPKPGGTLVDQAPKPGGTLVEPAQQQAGAMSIKDLEGDWVLTSLDGRKPVPAGVTATLNVRGREVSGSGGCNRYGGALTEGAAPGSLTFGPLRATEMACDGPGMDVELVLFQAFGTVSQFTFVDGQLALTYQSDDGPKSLRFKRRPQAPGA